MGTDAWAAYLSGNVWVCADAGSFSALLMHYMALLTGSSAHSVSIQTIVHLLCLQVPRCAQTPARHAPLPLPSACRCRDVLTHPSIQRHRYFQIRARLPQSEYAFSSPVIYRFVRHTMGPCVVLVERNDTSSRAEDVIPPPALPRPLPAVLPLSVARLTLPPSPPPHPLARQSCCRL